MRCQEGGSADFEGDDESQTIFKSLMCKMFWGFGFGCIAPHNKRWPPEKIDAGRGGKSLEHNKAWLLAEAGGNDGDESHSAHSSFRFSICSQMELEKRNLGSECSSSSTTVLMVNLDNGLMTDSKSGDFNCSRIESLERNISPISLSLIRFSYSEILSITRSFSQGRVLGRGALSCVFRGRVGFRRSAVAVKRLDKDDKESSKAFTRELMIASSLDHPHIVPLVGFCIDAENGLFLVYKYVSGGSLEQFLHEKNREMNGGRALSWSVRYKIAVRIAEALNYLHNGTERCVVHRDIKPSNILLSSRNSPRLCDFGLASWSPAPSVPFLCKMVKGTFGYLAPEYFQHGKVSDKTDIYAFGVVLLEIITGRKPIETRAGQGEENLVSWAKQILQQGSPEKLLDRRIEYSTKNSTEVVRLVQAAVACINNDEALRPGATEALEILRGAFPVEANRKKSILRGKKSTTDDLQLHKNEEEMGHHFGLAMLGIDFEDDE